MPELATALYHDLKRRFPVVLRRQRRHRPALPPDGRGGHAVRHHGGRRDAARPDGDGPAPRLDAAGAGRRSTRWRTTSRSGSADLSIRSGCEVTRACASPTSKRWSAAWPARCPREFLDGRRRDRRSRRAPSRIPTRAEHLHPGRVHPASRRPTAPAEGDPEPGRALPRLLRRRSRELDAGLRLAGGGVGDADPRAAAPPRVARPGARPRGVRPGGRAELRPPGRRGRSTRSSISTASPPATGAYRVEDDVFLDATRAPTLPPRSPAPAWRGRVYRGHGAPGSRRCRPFSRVEGVADAAGGRAGAGASPQAGAARSAPARHVLSRPRCRRSEVYVLPRLVADVPNA